MISVGSEKEGSADKSICRERRTPPYAARPSAVLHIQGGQLLSWRVHPRLSLTNAIADTPRRIEGPHASVPYWRHGPLMPATTLALNNSDSTNASTSSMANITAYPYAKRAAISSLLSASPRDCGISGAVLRGCPVPEAGASVLTNRAGSPKCFSASLKPPSSLVHYVNVTRFRRKRTSILVANHPHRKEWDGLDAISPETLQLPRPIPISKATAPSWVDPAQPPT